MNIRNLIANAKNVLKMEGILSLYRQIIPLLFMRKNIIIFKKDLRSIDCIQPDGNFEFRIIYQKGELSDLMKNGYSENGFNLYDLMRRLDAGEVMFMVFSQCLLVHKTSVLMYDTGTIDSPVKIDWAKEAYAQFVETNTLYRGLHIYPYVTSEFFEFARKNGKIFCVTSTTADNLSSIKAHLRAGYKISGKVQYTRLLLFFVLWKENRTG
jgi:hypothetical protein